MQNRAALLALAAGAAVLTACGSSTPPTASKVVNFTADLEPGNEPSVTGNPTGHGTLQATLDTSTNVFTYNVTFTGLLTNAKLGHIHGPFTQGATGSAGVIVNFDPANDRWLAAGATFVGLNTATSGSATGTVTLNAATQFSATINGDSLRKLLLANATYVNIHTPTNLPGEIRGQITVVK
jgi:hypothetical protein